MTEWVWANPHCFLKFEVKGRMVPSGLDHGNQQSAGYGQPRLEPPVLQPGDSVTVTVEPVKSGNTVGRVLEVAFPDGRVLSTRRRCDAGGGAARRNDAPRGKEHQGHVTSR